MEKRWAKVGGWLGRIRGFSTPWFGLAWEGPPARAPVNDGEREADSQGNEEPELSDLDMDVLALMARRDGEYLWTDDVVEELDVTWARAQHSLDVLEDQSLIRSLRLSHKIVQGDRAYELTPVGREMAIEEGWDE